MYPKLSCACGAVSASLAGYRQMSPFLQVRHLAKVVQCETCAKDRLAGRPPRPETGQAAGDK